MSVLHVPTSYCFLLFILFSLHLAWLHGILHGTLPLHEWNMGRVGLDYGDCSGLSEPASGQVVQMSNHMEDAVGPMSCRDPPPPSPRPLISSHEAQGLGADPQNRAFLAGRHIAGGGVCVCMCVSVCVCVCVVLAVVKLMSDPKPEQ